MSCRGKTAIVTGGGGGFGREISLALARAGAVVVVADKLPEAAAGVAAEVAARGGEGWARDVDLADPQAAARLVAAVAEKYGTVDILVNNAGVTLGKPAVEVTAGDWERVIAVNLKGSFFAAQAAGREMIRSGGGDIVNIASTAAHRAEINTAVYAVSKAGVVSLTRNLAREWAQYNIRVNAVAPGYARTPMTESLLRDEKVRAAFLKRIPLRRLAEPRDVAGAVLFLLSADAAYVTGHVLTVDGGQST